MVLDRTTGQIHSFKRSDRMSLVATLKKKMSLQDFQKQDVQLCLIQNFHQDGTHH